MTTTTASSRIFKTAALLLFATVTLCNATATLDMGAAHLSMAGTKPTELKFDHSASWRAPQSAPLLYLKTVDRTSAARSINLDAGKLHAEFDDGSTAQFDIETGKGFSLFRLKTIDLKSTATQVGLFQISVPEEAEIADTLNAAFWKDGAFAVMAAVPDVHAFVRRGNTTKANKPGCSHDFVQTTQSMDGSSAARFTAVSDAKAAGWAMRGRPFSSPIEISEFEGVKARIHGDGKGEALKIQFVDDHGGARDYYIPITFTGWKDIEVTSAALNTMGTQMTGLNIYYNGIPANSTVECVIDEIRALVRRDDNSTSTQLLEDFNDAESAWWQSTKSLVVEAESRYGIDGAAFGVIACPRQEFFQTVERFEKAAGIRATYPSGVWNKRSPAVKQSYLFLTSFKESQFDAAVALAHRGGFKRVLILQDSWCTGTGHYDINRTSFPDGVAGLARTVRRFREAGIETGLHVLGASIYPPDSYLTPVPDNRLVKGARTTLAAPLDTNSTTVVVSEMPSDFPKEDGGYTGKGTVLQIGSELIAYESRTATEPLSFIDCKRGHLGTRIQSHQAGEEVRHLVREYGYHMYDMDTSLLDEVTSNLAAVANAADVSMVYFDGSERLQGDHWRYNSRLIKAFTDRITRTDMLYQASSFTHYSWHLLARSASADGHGDLKGYLEERSPSFEYFALNSIPLDVGWYYGYDKSATPDMYEYILGATIGYDSSMSYQVSVDAAAVHPFTNEILNMISRYERLRLSGRVPQQVRELLRVHPALRGLSPEAPVRPNELRRDFRLLEKGGRELFQRVVYEPWRDLDATSTSTSWDVTVTTGPAEIGFQLQVTSGDTTGAQAMVRMSVNNEKLDWSGTLAGGQYLFAWPGEPMRRFGQMAEETTATEQQTPIIQLPEGKHKVELVREGAALQPMRVRCTVQPPERYVVP